MSDDHLSAKVHKGLMLPRLLFGLPWTFAVVVLMVAYEAVIVMHQYVIGAALVLIIYVVGRVATKRDVFFVDIITRSFRFKKVLK